MLHRTSHVSTEKGNKQSTGSVFWNVESSKLCSSKPDSRKVFSIEWKFEPKFDKRQFKEGPHSRHKNQILVSLWMASIGAIILTELKGPALFGVQWNNWHFIIDNWIFPFNLRVRFSIEIEEEPPKKSYEWFLRFKRREKQSGDVEIFADRSRTWQGTSSPGNGCIMQISTPEKSPGSEDDVECTVFTRSIESKIQSGFAQPNQSRCEHERETLGHDNGPHFFNEDYVYTFWFNTAGH